MRIYFDDVMRSARIGAEERRGRPVSAIDLLAGLQDAESASALADTLYRMGGPRGIPLIQESINAYYEARGLPTRIHVEDVSKKEQPTFGSETYGAFKAIVQDSRDRKLLLDLIADRRTVKYPREAWRNDYHRLPQNLPAAPEIIP